MSDTSFRRFKLIAVAVFILGLVSVALAYSLHGAKGSKGHLKGFTVVTKETITMADPQMQANPNQADCVISIRYQKSDGNWKEVVTAYKANGQAIRKDITFGMPGQGVFKIDRSEGTLNFLSSMPPPEVTSYVEPTDGHDKKRFLMDAVVQGYKTYVLHYAEDDGSYQDDYCAVDLNGYAIKSFKFTPRGSSVTEATQITLGDPDDRVFGSLPHWLVKYDRFKEKIAALEDDGKYETAEAMRRELDQQLAKHIRQQ